MEVRCGIGGYFEWQNGAGKSYYFAGAQRVAMRTGAGVKFLLGDHLGNTAVSATSSGGFYTEQYAQFLLQ